MQVNRVHGKRDLHAYAQSDQSLCLSLEYSMIVKLLIEHHLEFLNLKEAAEARPSLHLSNSPQPIAHARVQRGGRGSGPPPPLENQAITGCHVEATSESLAGRCGLFSILVRTPSPLCLI